MPKHKTTLSQRRKARKQSEVINHNKSNGRGWRVGTIRRIKKQQAKAGRDAVIAAAAATAAAIKADPALVNLTDEELAARNLAAAQATPAGA